jgi:chromosome segregation protein
MTRLKALELFGFKSFADRTRFEFPDGITVVVGPNGSGKSNVVDAIKWVLGEQSVRSLRGKEMTDVIFAGSAARRPLNVAEVSLIFDNSDRLLPVAANDVQIMRRVYRSGESEYLLNGEMSRLRDIRDLFSGTGAATEAYSVIEQGRVDALLVASGRDRRAVFEEAAGITKFRARRAESLRRLERAEQNRQRLADIVGEVSSRLDTVRQQAARARRWRLMTDRLRLLKITAAGRDLAEVDAAVADVEAALAAARRAGEQAEAQAAREATEAVTLASTSESLAPRLAAARATAATAAQRLATAEATLQLLRTRRHDVEADVARAAADLRADELAARDAVAAAARAADAAAILAAELEQLEAKLATCERAAEGSHEHAAAARQQMTAAAAAVDAHRRAALRRDKERDLAEARAQDARRQADAAHAAVSTAQLKLARLEESQAAWEGNLAALAAQSATVDRELEQLEAAQREQTAAIQSAWHELAGWRAKLEACGERRSMLREMVDRQEGLSEAARRLLATASDQIPGFAGLVADLVTASVEWAPLVDLALGGLGQGLVVDSLADAVAWHAAWSATTPAAAALAAGGRIEFLAASGLRPLTDYEPEQHPGIVGRLDRLVLADHAVTAETPDGEFARQIMHRLLGRVWVVERVEHALPAVATAPAGTLFMTRTGHCLAADGTFAIGSPAASATLVARRSELRALDLRYAELGRTTEAAAAHVAALEASEADLRQQLKQAAARRQQAAESAATSRGEFDRVVREHAATLQAIATAEADVRAAELHAGGLVAEAQSAAEACVEAARQLAVAEAGAATAQEAIEQLEKTRGEVIDEIHRLRVARATAAEKLARSRDAADSQHVTTAARRAAVTAARDRRRLMEDRLGQHDLELLAAEAVHAEAALAAEAAGGELGMLESEADDVEGKRRRTLAALETSRAAAAACAETIHARDLEVGEARHRRARILERIRDEYDIDIEQCPQPVQEPDAAPVPEHRPDLDAEIEELRRKLASMTSVNLEALAEAEELTGRLAKLEAQLADVTSAKASIEQLITHIDDESRRLLGETIETVRGHFRELFERVFGGGQADIVLEPGVDLLETSVEIMARPPGKEPRSISLLSGGEKTMTCVALLLAIFRSRPSPFCVLDEVDAALDEANVDRFAGVLRAFLSSTQFIVVTHSKKTMATANTLYGVTMEESGVSKRVSVRFESTVAAARAA